MENKGYIGKISNAGAQFVKAPVKPAGSGGKTVKHTGDDLRAGKSKG